MNTLHLKYAIEVERTGSISQAADNLFMGQPNLSKAIKELEDSVGVTIFRRTSKGVIPTKEGMEFLRYARNILRQVELMERIGQNDTQAVCSLSLIIPPDAEYLYYAAAAFAALPQTEAARGFVVVEMETAQALRNIIEGTYRLGILRYRSAYEPYYTDLLTSKRMGFQVVREFEMQALMSETHPCARATDLTAECLEGYVEVACSIQQYADAEEKDSRLLEETVEDKRIIIRDLTARLDMLEAVTTAYMWTPPLPERILKGRRLIQRCCGRGTYQDVLIYPKNYTMRADEMSFLRQVHEMNRMET